MYSEKSVEGLPSFAALDDESSTVVCIVPVDASFDDPMAHMWHARPAVAWSGSSANVAVQGAVKLEDSILTVLFKLVINKEPCKAEVAEPLMGAAHSVSTNAVERRVNKFSRRCLEAVFIRITSESMSLPRAAGVAQHRTKKNSTYLR